MDLTTNIDEIRQLLATFLNANITEREGVLQLDGEEAAGTPIAAITLLLDELALYESDGAAAIYTTTDFEVLVREEASFLGVGWSRRARWPYQLEDSDLISHVRTALTQPGFSFRRKPDVRARFQREDVTFSEPEALRIVLEKYVNIESIRDKLDALQETLVRYYAVTPVSFADSNTVDLRGPDSSKVIVGAQSQNLRDTKCSRSQQGRRKTKVCAISSR